MSGRLTMRGSSAVMYAAISGSSGMPISLQAAAVLLQPDSFGGGRLPVSGGTVAESEIDERPAEFRIADWSARHWS